MTDRFEIPARAADGHKGTFGTVLVVGGQAADGRVMIGGPAFSARAALRSGCGLAVLAMPESILAAGLTIAPGATGIALPLDAHGALDASAAAESIDRYAQKAHAIAIGPGLGADVPQQQLVIRLLAQSEAPIILDADGLNALAAIPDFQLDIAAPLIVTPHPGEFRRLAESLSIKGDPTDDEQRPDLAAHLAQRLGAVVVLKGARTVVTDGHRVHVSTAGNACLATAGTGDVLTGIIAGLAAQFVRLTPVGPLPAGLDVFECAAAAVDVHGRAADHWAERNGDSGMTAEDLIEELPAVIREHRAAE